MLNRRRGRRPRGFTVAINAGNAQSGTVGAALSTAISVVVRAAGTGSLASGATVFWVDSGDGSIVASSQTNGSGVASATWTLGTFAGTQRVTATVAGGGSVTFTATATAAAAATIAAVSVVDQSAATSTAVGVDPSVRVSDVYGNPVSGVSVTWAVASGGGSVDDTGGTTTGSDGLATVTSWTLGASVGANSLTATSAGLTGSPVTFTASATAAAPATITVVGGGTQTGVVVGQSSSPITYRVKDSGNTALAGVTVSFSRTGSGTLSASTGVTNASGDASVTLTTHTGVETATVAAECPDGAGGVIIGSTTVASTAASAFALAIVTQPSSSGTSGVALSQQPIIEVVDQYGNRNTSATPTVTASVLTGNAAISAGGSVAAIAGVATFSGLTLTDSDAGANILRFSTSGLSSVDSNGITLAPPVPTKLGIGVQPPSATVALTLSPAPTVQIQDASGVTVPGATNAVTVALGDNGEGATLSGTLTVNAVDGTATFSNLSVDVAGSYTLNYTSGSLTGVNSASFTVSAAAASKEPTDVTMTATIDTEWEGIALDTAFTLNGTYATMTASSNQARLRVRSLADQSWRSAAASAIPTSPSGGNVLVCHMTHGQVSGYFGNLYKSMAGAKTIYVRAVVLLSSNYVGENSQQFKYWDQFRTGGGNNYIASLRGADAAAIRSQHYFQGLPAGSTPNNWVAGTGDSITRNTWYTLEWVIVQSSAANTADGHATTWKDGVMTRQVTGINWATSGTMTWSQFELLHYWGGTGDTLALGGAGNQAYVVTDSLYVSTSTSRAAAPSS